LAAGGGLSADNGGTVTVRNATFTANGADGGSGGDRGSSNGKAGQAEGGGLFVGAATVTLHNSTVAFNQCSPGSGSDGNGAVSGGGVFNTPGGTVNAVSTIIAANSLVGPPAANRTDPDFSGSFTTAQNNLLGDGTGTTGISDGVNGNLVGTAAAPIDPKLRLLGNYGGPTLTLGLEPDSPAIDRGANPDGLTTDQRGFGPRAFNGVADIGAFEFGATPPPPSSQPPPPPVFQQVFGRVVRVNGRARLDIVDAATGRVRASLFPFGAFRGQVLVLIAELDGNGVGDVLVVGAQGGHVLLRAFSGTTLAPLPVG
jgi:hypothetical protein